MTKRRSYLNQKNIEAAISSIGEDSSHGFEVLADLDAQVADAKKRIYGALAGTDAGQTARSILSAMNRTVILKKNLAILDHMIALDPKELPITLRKRMNAVAPVGDHIFADAFAMLESDYPRVCMVAMNPRRYVDLRKYGRDLLEIEVQPALLKKGLMGGLWGAQVVCNRGIPKNEIWVVGEGEDSHHDPKRTIVILVAV